MNDKWLLILGAGSDMAIAVARRFAAAGWNIQLASRDLERLESEAADLRVRAGVEVQVHAFDALDFASHRGFYEGLSPSPAGVLVAFGAMQGGSESVIGTNFTGAASVLEAVAADFAERPRGFIAAISSVAGDRGRQSNYLYGSAKAGLSTYMAGLRHRLYRLGIPVLCIKPGFVATRMTDGMDLPERLTASTQEVAEAVFRRLDKGRGGVLYVKPVWRLIMLIIMHLPGFVFNRTKL